MSDDNENREDTENPPPSPTPVPITGPTVTYQARPPPEFDFTSPSEWPKWTRRWERFRITSRLETDSDRQQVNSLIYHMGDTAEDILLSFQLTEAQAEDYVVVVKKFNTHLIAKKKRVQLDGEPVEQFVTALYKS